MCAENLRLVRTLAAISDKKPSRLAESLVNVFEKRRIAASFVREVLADQIQRTSTYFLCEFIYFFVGDPRTIFRANSLATKVFDHYMKLVAKPHLMKMLKPIITEIMKGKKSCEVCTNFFCEQIPWLAGVFLWILNVASFLFCRWIQNE